MRVRANRQTRLNARIGKMKRRKQDEGQVCPLCSRPLAGSEQEMSRHVEHCLSKREGSCVAEDDAVDIEHENSNRFEEYEWCGQKRIRATTLLEGGFRGSGFVMCSGKENPDSDADLDVDGDDTLEYGKPQYTEADVIPCTGEEPGEAKEREALRGAVLNGGPRAPASHLSSLNGPVMRCRPPAMVKAASRKPCRRPARTVTLRKSPKIQL